MSNGVRHMGRVSSRREGLGQMRARGLPMVEIEFDALDIARRIQEGDELWRGDPNMMLTYNEFTGEYDVIAHDEQGRPYIAVSAKECDQRILQKLAESDWQRGSQHAINELVRREARAMAEREYESAQMSGAIADKVAWGIRKAMNVHNFVSFHIPGRA